MGFSCEVEQNKNKEIVKRVEENHERWAKEKGYK